MKAFSIFALLEILTALHSHAFAATRVSAELVSDRSVIAAGEPFRLGVFFKIPDRAHIYWSNPGDSGLPTQVEWTVAAGFVAGETAWPNPVGFHDEILKETSFGYAREVLLAATVHPPTELAPGAQIRVGAKATWLVCLDDSECIPESASLELTLSVAEKATVSPKSALFDEFDSRTPRAVAETGVPVEIVTAGPEAPRISVRLGGPWRADPAVVGFFPDRGGPWQLAQSQNADNRVSELVFAPVAKFDGPPSGAITLALRNAETGEARVLYLRFGGPAPGR
jgi:thiol:disulfide interchange protein DsbD